MPDRDGLIDFADQSKHQCREQLQQMMEAAVNELRQEGWELRCIVEALVELADDHMDNVICGTPLNVPSTRYH